MADADDTRVAPRSDDSLKPEFPPGLFVEDGEQAQLPPAYAEPQPVETPLPPTQPPAVSHKKRFLIIGAILVVAVAVAVTLLLIFQPWKSTDEVRQNFTDAVAGYQQCQTTLTQAISDAQATEQVKADAADSAVMDALESALDNASTLVGTPPDMAHDRGKIQDQTAQVTSQTQACDAAIVRLNQSTEAVTSSRVQYATDKLNDAVTAAQAALDQSKGTGDEAARSALAIAIGRTQAVIKGLPTADPATFAATITEQQTSLQQASQAVNGTGGTGGTTGTAPMTCDGVQVPANIDPIVCQSMPTAAIQTLTSGGSAAVAQFSMPSGNVGCTKDQDNGVFCEINQKSWALPAELVPDCQGTSCGQPVAAIKDGSVTTVLVDDPAPWAKNMADSNVTVPVLTYGQVANFSPVACLSNEHGVVCWDTTTHHGFQMNSDWFLYW